MGGVLLWGGDKSNSPICEEYSRIMEYLPARLFIFWHHSPGTELKRHDGVLPNLSARSEVLLGPPQDGTRGFELLLIA